MDGSGGSAGAMCLMSWAFDRRVIICSTNICRCVAPEVTGLEGGPCNLQDEWKHWFRWFWVAFISYRGKNPRGAVVFIVDWYLHYRCHHHRFGLAMRCWCKVLSNRLQEITSGTDDHWTWTGRLRSTATRLWVKKNEGEATEHSNGEAVLRLCEEWTCVPHPEPTTLF